MVRVRVHTDTYTHFTHYMYASCFIVLLWIHKDSSVPWVKELEDILTVFFDDDPPRAVKRQWKRILESYNFLTVVEDKILPGIQNIKVGGNFLIIFGALLYGVIYVVLLYLVIYLFHIKICILY